MTTTSKEIISLWTNAHESVLRRERVWQLADYPLMSPPGRLPVIMEDEIIHTVDYPVCDDPDCCCYGYEREQIMAETAPRRRRRRQPLLDSSYVDTTSSMP